MNYVPIVDDEGKALPEPGARLVAFLAFPTDGRSQAQLLSLLHDELAEFDRKGPSQYQPSALSDIVGERIEMAVPKYAVAGLVTLAFWLGAGSGKSALTLYGAAKAVQEVLRRVRKIEGHRPLFSSGLEAGREIHKAFRVVSDRKDIEKHFREYHVTSTLTAAQFFLQNEPVKSFGDGLRQDAPKVIRTAFEIERRVLSTFPQYFPNLIRFRTPLPAEFAHSKLLDLPRSTEKLFSGLL